MFENSLQVSQLHICISICASHIADLYRAETMFKICVRTRTKNSCPLSLNTCTSRVLHCHLKKMLLYATKHTKINQQQPNVITTMFDVHKLRHCLLIRLMLQLLCNEISFKRFKMVRAPKSQSSSAKRPVSISVRVRV